MTFYLFILMLLCRTAVFQVLDNPSGATITAASRTNSSRNFYPRDSFVQFTARSTAAAGLYLATEDGAGHVKRWLFSSKLRE